MRMEILTTGQLYYREHKNKIIAAVQKHELKNPEYKKKKNLKYYLKRTAKCDDKYINGDPRYYDYLCEEEKKEKYKNFNPYRLVTDAEYDDNLRELYLEYQRTKHGVSSIREWY